MDEALIQEQERQLQKTGRYYKHVFWLCVPLLCMACYFYGARPLLLCGIALLTGNLCDRLVALLRHRVYTNKDLSNESFSLIIALLMPATVDIYVLVVAVLAGVLIGKEVFGGYGSYPFNPAAVGYAVAAVSWPEQVVRYPQPYTPLPLWNASAVPVSSTIEDTLRSGGILNLNALAVVLGEFAAPMGTGAALVILACGLVLWTQKDVHIGASASFLITCGLIVKIINHRGTENREEPADTAVTMQSGVEAVYYEYGARCPICIRMETWTREAVEKNFPVQLEEGKLAFHAIPADKEAVGKYELVTKSLILKDWKDGKETRWVNLNRIWDLSDKEQEFKAYVVQSVRKALDEAH